jgi:hypothetical protein
LLAHPGLFADEVRALKGGTWVIVDEIQRLPGLLNEVHRFMEEKRLRFILCGSSARKLKSAGVNLLAGRALRRSMHPFVPEELGGELDLERALQFGLLPVVWDSDAKADTLAAYAQFYLKEEIQAEASATRCAIGRLPPEWRPKSISCLPAAGGSSRSKQNPAEASRRVGARGCALRRRSKDCSAA